MSYATKSADVGAELYFYAEIEGIPSPRALSTVQLKFTTGALPSFASQGDWIPGALADYPSHVEQRLDLRGSKVEGGGMELRVADLDITVTAGLAPPLTGTTRSRFPTRLFAARATTKFQVKTDLAVADTNLDVKGVLAGEIAIGDRIYIGLETMRVTAVTTVGPDITALTVVRAAFGSRAVAHKATTATEIHASAIYKEPGHWYGRKVVVKANYVGEVENEARTVFTGLLDDLTYDAGVWTIRATSSLARLERRVNRVQWHGQVVGGRALGGIDPEEGAAYSVQVGDQLHVEAYRPGETRVSPTAAVDSKFYVRIGDDSIAEVKLLRDYTSSMSVLLEVTAVGLLGTPVPTLDVGIAVTPDRGSRTRAYTTSARVVEVYPTDPSLASGVFKVDSVRSANPIDLMLNVIVSSGLGTNKTVGKPDWDSAPERIALYVPIADVDEDSFLLVRALTHAVAPPFAAFILGADNKPFSPREWIESELLPVLGAVLIVRDNGKLALKDVSATGVLDAATALTDKDCIGTPTWSAALPSVVTGVVWKYPPEHTVTVIPGEFRELYPERDDLLEIELAGLSPYANRDVVVALMDRGMRLLGESFDQPLVSLTLRWKQHTLEIGDVVSLDVTGLPLPTGALATGALVTPPVGRVVRKQLDPSTATVKVDVALYPRSARHYSPTIEVTAWDAGNLRATCKANDFTDVGESGGPLRDVLGFVVADRVRLYSKRRAGLSDNVVTVAGLEVGGANTIDFNTAFTLGAGAATPAVGDLIAFEPYTAAATARMKDSYAAYSDETALNVGATTDGPHRHG